MHTLEPTLHIRHHFYYFFPHLTYIILHLQKDCNSFCEVFIIIFNYLNKNFAKFSEKFVHIGYIYH